MKDTDPPCQRTGAIGHPISFRQDSEYKYPDLLHGLTDGREVLESHGVIVGFHLLLLPGLYHGLAHARLRLPAAQRQDGGAGAADHGSPGTCPHGRLPHLGAVGNEGPAVRLMEAIVETVADQGAVAVAQTREQHREGREITDRILQGNAPGQRTPGLTGGEAQVGDGHHGPHPLMPGTGHHPPTLTCDAGREAKSTQERGHYVVRMPFHRNGQLQQFFPTQGLAKHDVGATKASHNGAGAAAQAAGRGRGQGDPGFQGDGGMAGSIPGAAGRSVEQVIPAASQVGSLGAVHNQVKPLVLSRQPPQAEAVVELQGGPQAVETGADVGSGGWYGDDAPLAGVVRHDSPGYCLGISFHVAPRPASLLGRS